MARAVLILFYIFSFCEINFAQEIKFLMPLKGIQGKDFFIVGYVDHDTTKGIRDAFCGNLAVNGHNGIDFALRSFAIMDSGVYVYAVADGKVFEEHDGDDDRNTVKKSGGFGNHIAVVHNNGLRTYYGHLMKNSVLVKMNDSVKAGQPIGKVGSSGYSGEPHLHFEIRDRQNGVVDPFSGNCQANTPSLWVSQPEYDARIYAIDNGFVSYLPKWDDILNHRLLKDTFYKQEDTLICFWVRMHGMQKGKNVRVDWFAPGGYLEFSHSFIWDGSQMGFAWPYLNMPDRKGKWTVSFFVDDTLITSGIFYVEKHRHRTSN